MCTGLEVAGLSAIGSVASATASIAKSMDKGPDPAEERAKAEAEATQLANGKISMQRKAMRDNSLFTGAGGATLGGGMASTGRASAAAGRSTLGV